MSRRFLLDTNIISHFLRKHAVVGRRLFATPLERVCVSAISEGELRFGLAHKKQSPWLHEALDALLISVVVLPWTSVTAIRYGTLRAELAIKGKPLGPLDLLIAAQALEAGAILVTNDAAFAHVDGLSIEDWTRDAP